MMEQWQTISFNNLNEALLELNAVDKGRYYICDCPQCNHHEAYIKKGSNFVNCNRKNNCGIATRLQLKAEQNITYKSAPKTVTQLQKEEIKLLGEFFEYNQLLREETGQNDVVSFFLAERSIGADVLNSSNVALLSHSNLHHLAEIMPNTIDQKYNADWANYRNIIFGFKNPETDMYERLLLRTTNKNEKNKELQIILQTDNAVTFTEFGDLQAEKVYIVESVIDGLSLLEIADEPIKVIALSGVNGVNRLADYMINNVDKFKGKDMHIVLDNDKAGIDASNRLTSLLHEKHSLLQNLTNEYPTADIKDLNQFLQDGHKDLLHEFLFDGSHEQSVQKEQVLEQRNMFDVSMQPNIPRDNALTFENVKRGAFELVYTIDEQVARQNHRNSSLWRDYEPEAKDNIVKAYMKEFVDTFDDFVTEQNKEKLNERLRDYNKLIVELHEQVYRANKIPSSVIVGGANYPSAKKEAQNDRIHKLEGELYSDDGKRARFINNTHDMFNEKRLAYEQAKKAKKQSELAAAGLHETYEVVEHEELAGYGLDVEQNRVYVRTHGKPSAEIRNLLKKAGMRYSPKNVRWQRQITKNAFKSLERFFSAHDLIFDVEKLKGNNEPQNEVQTVRSVDLSDEEMVSEKDLFKDLLETFRGNRSKENALALFDELTAGVKAAFADPMIYKEMLLYTTKLPHYSLRNQMLLYRQMSLEQRSLPICNTFKGWKEQGVQVQKGAKAFAVLHPKTLKFFERNGEYVSLSKATAAEKQGMKTEQLKVFEKQTFKYVFNLFHIQQTNADIDAYIEKEHIKSAYSPEQKEQLFSLLKQKIEDNGTLVLERDLLRIKGMAQVRKEHVITLNTRNTIDENIASLLHEYAHDLLHYAENSFSQEDKEAQAESISFMMCKVLGIENKSSFDYIAGFADQKDEKIFSANMKQIMNGFQKMQEKLDLSASKKLTQTVVKQKVNQTKTVEHRIELAHEFV